MLGPTSHEAEHIDDGKVPFEGELERLKVLERRLTRVIAIQKRYLSLSITKLLTMPLATTNHLRRTEGRRTKDHVRA